MLLRWLRSRRERRALIDRDAAALVYAMGDAAHAEAHDRARIHRAMGDKVGVEHWTLVAEEIACLKAEENGGRAADRLFGGEPVVPNRKAIIHELVTISEAIRDLSTGKSDVTTLHNAEAAVHRLVALAGEGAEATGLELRCALHDLSSHPQHNAEALARGEYPPFADAAGRALGRLKTAALRS